MDKKYKVKADTIARTIILALALINQLLSASGHPVIPIPDEDWETLVSTAFTIIIAIVAWWKNNSWTQAALAGDQAKDEVKAFGKQVGGEK